MPAIYLTEHDVDRLITVPECIPVIEEAMLHFGRGVAVNQPRRRLRSENFSLQTMAAAITPMGVAGYKNGGSQARRPSGAVGRTGGTASTKVFLYSTETNELLAVLDASRLGQVRTGAATGVGTKYQARAGAATVGVFGSGYQARTQLEAVCAVRPIKAAKVFSRTPEHREMFAREMSEKLGITVTPVAEPEQAARGCDIVVTITNTQQPVLQGAWLDPGTHVNAAGGNSLIRGEVDAETVRRAGIVTADSVEDARLECADLMRAVEAGAINWEQVRELGHVVAGLTPGRTSDDQITLFESHGLALWDVAAAGVVYRKAKAQGIGVPMPF
jgi:ornithine cyclodeaminase/alanine dehydrogenase-like protein (mu-crystallin family)